VQTKQSTLFKNPHSVEWGRKGTEKKIGQRDPNQNKHKEQQKTSLPINRWLGNDPGPDKGRWREAMGSWALRFSVAVPKAQVLQPLASPSGPQRPLPMAWPRRCLAAMAWYHICLFF